jgi:hypothetical protein
VDSIHGSALRMGMMIEIKLILLKPLINAD